jgi:hypothetical protein
MEKRCEECEEMINPKRLAIFPQAIYCVRCTELLGDVSKPKMEIHQTLTGGWFVDGIETTIIKDGSLHGGIPKKPRSEKS